MAILLRTAASERPTAPAVADPGRALDRSGLDERVNRWIHLLRAQGLRTGDRVAVLAGNRPDVFEALLAGLHTGLTVVPVNWHLTLAEAAYQLQDSGAALVLTDPARAAVAVGAAARCRPAPRVLLLGRADAAGPASAGIEAIEAMLAQVPGDEPQDQVCGATMLYTSGTTGRPKGVLNGLFQTGAPFRRSERLVDYAQSVLGVPGTGTALLCGPWYHSAQLFFSLLPLLAGARLVITERFDPAAFLRVVDADQVTSCHLVPTQFARLLALPQDVRDGFDGSSLRRVWHGGAPCPPTVKQAMLQWWGECLVEYYAATEAGVVTLIEAVEWVRRPGSVGRPVPGTQVVVVDDTGAELPPGRTGRVYVRRSTRAGFVYHNAPEKTAQAYLEDGVFTYGELGHLDQDGYLYLAGRFHDTVISGGVNVYPAEVERILLDHPAVLDAAVIGLPDEDLGERVAAVVELGPGLAAADAPRVLEAHSRERLAPFKVPRSWTVVPQLPREVTGKIRKEELRRRYTGTATIGAAASATATPAASATATLAPSATATLVALQDQADIAHPATYGRGVPHATYARLRRQSPVVRVPEPLLVRHSSAGRTAHRGPGYWAVLGHAALVDACRRPEDFSSAERGAFLVDPRTRGDLERARELLVNMDAPRHSRIRKIVTSVFTARSVQRLVAGVEAHAEAVVARAVELGACDGVDDLAAELPLLVLADLLGIPAADRSLLFRWGNQLVGFDDPEYGGGDVDAYRQTFVEAFGYARAVAQDRRARPGPDLASLIANAEVDGRRLSDREFCHFWLLLIVAGNETTRHLLSGSLLALAGDEAQRHLIGVDPQAVPAAVEELLRWVSPIMQFRRTAVRDTELAGQPIAAGDKVVLYFTAANRDPEVFADPDRLDLTRRPNPHLGFGIGAHFCLGAGLARVEAAAMLRALRPHLAGLELTGAPVRLESNFVNGLKSLPLRLSTGRDGAPR